MHSRFVITLMLVQVAAPACLLAQANGAGAPSTSGQARGTLLLEGGGRLGGTDIITRFVALAGGADRNVVLITTAIADSQFTTAQRSRCEARGAQIFGVARVTCLDARDRTEANSARFTDALRRADGVWIYGGDEERLVDRYVGTRTVAALRAVLDHGGVVGGTSAGAMILASYVPVRGTLPESAFGFLTNATIAPHYAQRHYEGALRRTLATHPRMTGIGIDEGTAIVVHGSRFDVIGEGGVTVMGERTAVLHAGEGFQLGASAPKEQR